MALYNTPQEKRDVALLESLGFEVVNPNTPACDRMAKKYGMAYFTKFAVECDALAFRGLPGGAIPGGVAKEIYWFKEAGKPIIELPTFALRQQLSKEDTREYLHEVGAR
jgi:hypothetical protein